MKCSRLSSLGGILLCLLDYQSTSAFNLPHSHRASNRRAKSRVIGSSSFSKTLPPSVGTTTRLKSSASSRRGPEGWKERAITILSGPDPQRPAWAHDWMPTWLVSLRTTTQLAAALLLYIFHLTVLTQHSIPFPFQLIPNERGHFQSIGLDS
jgi:hypothetical protein